MARDSLNRRNRFDAPHSTGKRICLTERDFLIFSALERHGVLPATYLYEFGKYEAANIKGHQQRLTDLYHEDNTAHGGRYLIRPHQQWASPHARYQPISYELSSYGVKALHNSGMPSQSVIQPSGAFIHRAMTACITASIDLTCHATNLRYISQSEILHRAGCTANNPLTIATRLGTTIPDQLFGIDYGGMYRFFALEADRSTESLASQKHHARSIEAKLQRYVEILEQETFKQTWGIPMLYILVVTTSARHMQNMMRIIERIANAKIASRFLFKTEPVFGKYWIVPEVLHGLARERWHRTGQEFGLLEA
jgi:hypothetical protein